METSSYDDTIPEFDEALIEYIEPLVPKSLDTTQPQVHNSTKMDHLMDITSVVRASIRALTSLSLPSTIYGSAPWCNADTTPSE